MRTVRLNAYWRREIASNYRTAQCELLPEKPKSLNKIFEERVLALALEETNNLRTALGTTELFDMLSKGGSIKIEPITTPKGYVMSLNSIWLDLDLVKFNKLKGYDQLVAQYIEDVDNHLHSTYIAMAYVYEDATKAMRERVRDFTNLVDEKSSTKSLLTASAEALDYFPEDLIKEMNQEPVKKTKKQPILTSTFTI
jgi:hypothetical protein